MTKSSKLNVLNINFKNNDELKELLLILGLEIDSHTKTISDSFGNVIMNSNFEAIDYRKVFSILPGSKFVIEKNDLTAVSRYYNEVINL